MSLICLKDNSVGNEHQKLEIQVGSQVLRAIVIDRGSAHRLDSSTRFPAFSHTSRADIVLFDLGGCGRLPTIDKAHSVSLARILCRARRHRRR